VRKDAEITLEANPEDVTTAAVRAWRSAGVNRISLGVQSFDERTLAWMHRTHDATAARSALQQARDEGIANISIDLIFALPSSLERSWARDLDTALALELPHVSVYGLTIEQQTPLGRWVADHRVSEAPEEVFASEFSLARDMLRVAGYQHYEVSNYAKPGFHSRHNWAYWCRKPYGGIGPSAHEFNGVARRWNAEAYVEWVSRTARAEDPLGGHEVLTEDQIRAEEVYLKLRTTAGLPVSAAEREHVAPWAAAGWADIKESTIHLTGAGWLRLDALATDLTLFRSRY
jgi:oxygen-independent coproporphyrinogen-3 oxidase